MAVCWWCASAGWRCLPLATFSLGVFLVLFLRFFARSLPAAVAAACRWLFVGALGCLLSALLVAALGWLSAAAVVAVVGGVAFAVVCALLALSSALAALARLVARLLFVRVPRPVRRPVAAAGRWVCVPASALGAVRARSFVWAVRPAVVARRSGVVSFFWVFGCFPPPSLVGR